MTAEIERRKKVKGPTRPATAQAASARPPGKKREKKELVRPKTAKGAPIVTPQFDG
jgi:hypothetical protein